jgi:hypothetical protein
MRGLILQVDIDPAQRRNIEMQEMSISGSTLVVLDKHKSTVGPIRIAVG